jgi:hypothetical protein
MIARVRAEHEHDEQRVPEAQAVREPAPRAPIAERFAAMQAGGNRALGRWLARQAGWANSPHAQNRAPGTYSGVRRIPVSGIQSPGPGRALVLLSPGFTAGQQCDVLVHMHGANVGYDDGTQPRDLNSAKDRIEEQLQLANRSQMVVVMPQGASDTSYGSQLGRVNPRDYSREALQKCVDAGELTVAPTIGSVLLSGHSGGGFAIKQILDRDAQRNDLSGVIYMDAIQRNNARSTTSTGQIEAAKALIVERITAELNRGTDANSLRNGFSFRAYYDSSGSYAGTGGEISRFIQGLFGENGEAVPQGQSALAQRIAALATDARAALRARYQTISVAHVSGGQAHTDALRAGTVETTGHENMVGSNAILDTLSSSRFGMPQASTAPSTPAPPANPPGQPRTGELDLWWNDPSVAVA